MRRTTPKVFSLILIGMITSAPLALARPSYFDSQCLTCHLHQDDNRTCIGCHHHGQPRVAFTDKSSYVGGSTVTVTLGGPGDSGWARALLYDENGFEVARITGPTNTGDDGTTRPTMQYPFTLRGKAPLKPGTYTWQATTWGSPYDTIGIPAFPHMEAVRVETNQFTVLPGGPTPPSDVATIKIVGISPRVRDASPTDAYNSRASGLDVVGINTYVYLTPQSTTTTIATNYSWSVIREPIPALIMTRRRCSNSTRRREGSISSDWYRS